MQSIEVLLCVCCLLKTKKRMAQALCEILRLEKYEVDHFDSAAFEHGQRLNPEIKGNVTVVGDADRLAQLVSILVDNAIRHGKGGGGLGRRQGTLQSSHPNLKRGGLLP